MTTCYTYFDSPVGELLLVADSGTLIQVSFEKRGKPVPPDHSWTEKVTPLRPTIRQLKEYFKGSRREFDLDFELRGTEFQLAVWDALCSIPFGETISYGELAHRIGRPKAARAVGAANGQNPIPIIVPCHRVIGSDGTLTGFGGGLPTKQALLDRERYGGGLFASR